MDHLFLLWAFVGCLYWFWMVYGAIRTVRGVGRLPDLPPGEPAKYPKLSIIVPACNEAESIGTALQSLLTQDYPDFEIIAVDDRSTDSTGQIIDQLAACDQRLRPLHVRELPAGWLGKVHALDCAVAIARGDWLLMTDADVHYQSDTLRRAVVYAQQRRLDHLALAPRIWPGTAVVNVCVAMFLRAFCVAMRAWAVEDPRSRAVIGVGAFNLVRRSALEKTPGFAWLRMEVADDVGLGTMLKQAGFRSGLANGVGDLAVQWYPDLAAMARGAEKGYAPVGQCNPLRMLWVGGVSLLTELAPLSILWAIVDPRVLWLGVPMLLAAVLSNVAMCRWGKAPIWPGLCFPLGALLLVGLILRAAWLGWRRGGVVWRGTLYPSESLRGGSRVRFP